jgi:hypothetical protein
MIVTSVLKLVASAESYILFLTFVLSVITSKEDWLKYYLEYHENKLPIFYLSLLCISLALVSFFI